MAVEDISRLWVFGQADCWWGLLKVCSKLAIFFGVALDRLPMLPNGQTVLTFLSLDFFCKRPFLRSTGRDRSNWGTSKATWRWIVLDKRGGALSFVFSAIWNWPKYGNQIPKGELKPADSFCHLMCAGSERVQLHPFIMLCQSSPILQEEQLIPHHGYGSKCMSWRILNIHSENRWFAVSFRGP